MSENFKYIEVPVRIPNLEGDGIAETHTVRVPVTIDPDTGDELLTEEAVKLIDDIKARYMGLLRPKQIRELRARFGLTQKQMSELLQAGEKSYTRWESGRARPSRMVNVLLRLLYEGKVSIMELVRIQKPQSAWQESVGALWLQHCSAAWKLEDWGNELTFVQWQGKGRQAMCEEIAEPWDRLHKAIRKIELRTARCDTTTQTASNRPLRASVEWREQHPEPELTEIEDEDFTASA
jgi:DNA-binding transcriptional regulator YiaG